MSRVNENLMRMTMVRATGCAMAMAVLFAMLPRTGMSQQIGIQTPFTSASDSFFERFGVSFGFQFPGGQGSGSRIVGYNGFSAGGPIRFSQGGFGSAIPQFGGYDPNASARTGFGYVTPGGGGFSLGFEFGQGSTRSLTNTTPGIVVQNGYGGTISSGAFRPFVTGVIPVTGQGGRIGQPDNAVTRAIQSGQLSSLPAQPEPEYRASDEPMTYSRQNSSAVQGDISVAEIKRQRALKRAALERELDELAEQVRQAEEAEDYRLARRLLRKMLTKIDAPQRRAELKSHLKSLHDK